jgi:hypothetical protein
MPLMALHPVGALGLAPHLLEIPSSELGPQVTHTIDAALLADVLLDVALGCDGALAQSATHFAARRRIGEREAFPDVHLGEGVRYVRQRVASHPVGRSIDGEAFQVGGAPARGELLARQVRIA